MNKLFYFCLEPLKARYTWQLRDWAQTAFNKAGIDYEIINGSNINAAGDIVTGSVLDAHGRCYWALTQTAELVKLMQQGQLTSNDVILVEDMFHPGLESLAYIYCQTDSTQRPKIFVRCWAQSFDIDDFIHRTGMFDWMRKYEEMIDQFISGIFVANEELAANIRISGIKSPVYVVGLPFDSNEVRNRVGIDLKPIQDRKNRVVFASRWDEEKQPHFFLDIVESVCSQRPDIEFTILSSHSVLKSSKQEFVDRAYQVANKYPNFVIRTGLSKEEYYQTLADSKILLNTALQDWIAFTNLEADALGVHTISPAYKGMPETFSNNVDHLYIPWSKESAINLIMSSIDKINNNQYQSFNIGHLSAYCDNTIQRQIECMTDNGAQYERSGTSFRQYTSTTKY